MPTDDREYAVLEAFEKLEVRDPGRQSEWGSAPPSHAGVRGDGSSAVLQGTIRCTQPPWAPSQGKGVTEATRVGNACPSLEALSIP